MTKADRCDRCGAAAIGVVLLHTGVLMFCGHHWRMYYTGFFPIAVAVSTANA